MSFKRRLKDVRAGSDVVSGCEDIAVKSPQSCLGKKRRACEAADHIMGKVGQQ